MGCAKPGQLAPGTHMCEQHSLPREPEEHLPGVPGSVLPLSAAGVPDSMGVCTRARALSLSLLSSISALATAISPVVHFSASKRQQMLTAAAVTLAAGHSTGHRGGQSSSRV